MTEKGKYVKKSRLGCFGTNGGVTSAESMFFSKWGDNLKHD